MALRFTMQNGGGDRYAYPYRNYVKPSPYVEPIKSVGLIDPSQVLNGGTDVSRVAPLTIAERLDLKKRGAVEVVETKNGNGETIQIAIDENGDTVATKKKPNIMPLVLTAAAAWFFLM